MVVGCYCVFILTAKSTAPKVFIRLFDRSSRSTDVSGASAVHGTPPNALFGRPRN